MNTSPREKAKGTKQQQTHLLGPSPVLGLLTWQSSCTLLLTGQAAGVGQEKVYSQSCTALMNRGLEF